jgi:hypothetical protein
MARQPPNGPGRLRCRGFTITLSMTSLDGWSARHRNLCLTTHNSHNTDIHGPDGIRTRNPNKRAAADPRLRPRATAIVNNRRLGKTMKYEITCRVELDIVPGTAGSDVECNSTFDRQDLHYTTSTYFRTLYEPLFIIHWNWLGEQFCYLSLNCCTYFLCNKSLKKIFIRPVIQWFWNLVPRTRTTGSAVRLIICWAFLGCHVYCNRFPPVIIFNDGCEVIFKISMLHFETECFGKWDVHNCKSFEPFWEMPPQRTLMYWYMMLFCFPQCKGGSLLLTFLFYFFYIAK